MYCGSIVNKALHNIVNAQRTLFNNECMGFIGRFNIIVRVADGQLNGMFAGLGLGKRVTFVCQILANKAGNQCNGTVLLGVVDPGEVTGAVIFASPVDCELLGSNLEGLRENNAWVGNLVVFVADGDLCGVDFLVDIGIGLYNILMKIFWV